VATYGAPPQLTEDDFLDVLRRNFEDHWIIGLLEDPTARSLFIGAIAQLLRIQDAADENFSIGSFILSAPGPARASSTIRLFRAGGGSAVTVTVDKRFIDSRAAVWVPAADYDIPASGVDQTVDMPVVTDREGYYLNTFLPLTYQALDTLPDPNLEIIDGVDAATDGTTSFLDQHGEERKVFRAEGESDSDYAHRIRFLEDQVSPSAIAETAIQVLDQFVATQGIANLAANFGLRLTVEPFTDSAQPSQRGLIGDPAIHFDDPLYAYFDDPLIHFRDLFDACAWFDIYLPAFADPDEARLFFDDGYFDDPEFGYMDAPPGVNITSPIAALADELDRRRPHCVRFRIFVGEDSRIVRYARFGELTQAGTWVDQDGNSTDTDLVEAVNSFDGDTSYVVTTTGAGGGGALAVDDLLFTIAALPSSPVSVSRVILRARVRRRNLAVGNPDFTFVVRPSTGSAVRVSTAGLPKTISSESYEEVIAVLEENPVTAAAWVVADVAGGFGIGVANTSGAATDELRVSELSVEFVVDYG
jgi:hypothetical protein